MLAWRTTWHVKTGMMDKALEEIVKGLKLAEEVMAEKGIPMKGEWRVYTPLFSPDVLVYETNFKTKEDHQAFSSAIDRESDAAKAWLELIDHKGTNELWKLTKS